MGRLLAVIVLLATMATPAAAIDVPGTRAQVVCPPVTLADLAPPEADAPPDEPPGETPPPAEEPPPADEPPPEPPPPADPPCDTPFVYEMGSPLMQRVSVYSSFGAPRPPDRLHKGIDLAVPKMTPVFAVAEGTVVWISDECCNLAVDHRDGWRSYYIHLNNDTFGTDDGLGTGVAPGIEVGVRVEPGQLLGWVGDSGNAEETEPHLHFELRMPNGEAIDAAASLLAAEPVPAPALPEQPEPAEDGTVPPVERFPDTFTGAFVDDDGHPEEWLVNMLASWGLVESCDISGVLFCPDAVPSGDELAGMLAAAGFEPPPRPAVYEHQKVRDPGSSLEDGLAVRGCGTRRYCPDQPVTPVEATGLLERSGTPVWLPPHVETLECASLDRVAVTRSGLLLRMAEIMGAVLEPPCDLID